MRILQVTDIHYDPLYQPGSWTGRYTTRFLIFTFDAILFIEHHSSLSPCARLRPASLLPSAGWTCAVPQCHRGLLRRLQLRHQPGATPSHVGDGRAARPRSHFLDWRRPAPQCLAVRCKQRYMPIGPCTFASLSFSRTRLPRLVRIGRMATKANPGVQHGRWHQCDSAICSHFSQHAGSPGSGRTYAVWVGWRGWWPAGEAPLSPSHNLRAHFSISARIPLDLSYLSILFLKLVRTTMDSRSTRYAGATQLLRERNDEKRDANQVVFET
jgi:hypothetical protein